MRQHILPIYSYFNKANYKKKKKNKQTMVQRPKHPWKLFLNPES
jgi:hypothetical protein